MDLILNEDEIQTLFLQDPSTRGNGGFQSLMVRLQEKCDRTSGAIKLTPADREQIRRYAFDYKNGGWETRLVRIFGRHLGPRLDKET